MGKVNYRRLKTWKVRVKLPPNKIIDPESLYNRDKEKEKLRAKLESIKSLEDVDEDISTQ